MPRKFGNRKATTYLGTTVPVEVYDRIKAEVLRRQISLRQLLEEALEAYFIVRGEGGEGVGAPEAPPREANPQGVKPHV
jgi:hypothetical protein